jgi:FemAB-related protein (PEP-CTERM system-associated)
MLHVVQYEEQYRQQWDDYVIAHPNATCYHLTAWKRAVERAYGSQSYYYLVCSSPRENGGVSNRPTVVGILPLFHLKNFVFGNALVSLPFCDYGGILADDEHVLATLVQKSTELSRDLNNATVEFRNIERMTSELLITSSHKVRMVRELSGDSDKLWKSFDTKLKSQIRKPQKEGLTCNIGGVEQLNDFYKVFSFNMRDLGSPVHSKILVKGVLEEFGNSSKLQVVYKSQMPIGAGLILSFRDTVFIPWASTVRRFNPLSPNMMLYWNFLKYASDNQFLKFDFGRSSPEEGTYKFKAQWGAKASPLYWQYVSLNDRQQAPVNPFAKQKYSSLVSVWKKLPLPLANMLGPYIRRHISL